MSKLVCLDAGHGGVGTAVTNPRGDSGACGNGLKEKDITLKMVNKVGEILKSQGINIVYTRTSDVYVALGERCRIANSSSCNIFVSIHTNSHKNTSANGIETLCYTKNSLASYIQQNLIAELKLTDRGVKERKDLYVLNSTSMQAVLVELGFISNSNEAALMKQESFLNKAAECIAKGICKYLGVNYKESAEMKADKVKRPYKYENKTKEFEVISVDGKNYAAVRDIAELLGKTVSYNNETKMTTIND